MSAASKVLGPATCQPANDTQPSHRGIPSSLLPFIRALAAALVADLERNPPTR
jgi:hypothetical protein